MLDLNDVYARFDNTWHTMRWNWLYNWKRNFVGKKDRVKGKTAILFYLWN